ncbi:MAG TPA: rhomboid family intramembrane serine protease [Thermoleophilaceae bacterium]|jgi:membrane associated rhomboid family serine protease|nr:rhomboid family intramembrane serine protease [Thermoleophilaceae bacterium]
MDVCYRHTNRETGVHCSNCGRPICPDCMTSTSVGMRCPECASQRTQVRTMRSATSEPRLTYLLIGINVVVFLGATLGGASATGGGVSGSDLLTEGALSRAAIADGEYWRLLTAGFLHAGFFHLMLNMLSLWILGSILEPAVGRVRFALIYFVSLLCGSFGALLLQPSGLTVGASGAIFGLMASAAIYARNRGLSLMESGLGVWIALNLVITFVVPGISIGGHIGGLIGGALATLVLFDLRDQVRLGEAVSTVLCAVVGLVAVAGSIVVAG